MANEIQTKFTFDPGDSVQKVESFRTKVREAKEALFSMTEEDPRWPQVFKNYTELINKQRELSRLARATDPANQVKNYMRLGEAGVGAFTAVRSAAVLFGGASEEALKKIEELEALMGLLKGLKAFDEGIRTAREMYAAVSATSKASKIAAVESKALGQANVAQAEATEGATLATKGLGYAMKGIGIGLIIAAVAYLVDNWKELKNQFQGLLPNVGSMSGSFDKLKQIFVGVGSVVVNLVITPIKLLITQVKTAIDVFNDIKSGHFGKIFEDIGKGVKDGIEQVKDGFNVVKNFREGEEASARSQAEARRKEELQKEIDHLDDVIAIRKEKGQETFQLELKQLNDKKELYKDDEKETRKNNLEIEKLLIDHHKKLAEEAKKAAEKAAEEARKEAAKEEQISKDHLRRQAETEAKAKEEQFKEAAELLKGTEEFLKKGEELDEDSDVKKLARLTESYHELRAKTIQAHGDLNAIEVSYEKQRRQIISDMQQAALQEVVKRYEKYVSDIEKADSQLEKNTKLTYSQKIADLKESDRAIDESLRQGVINDTVALRAKEINAEAEKRIDRELEESKKKMVSAIGGALNALSNVVGKHTAAGKAIAVGQAIINTYQGATMALASAPPPFSFVEAAAVTAAGLLSVKKILSTKVGSGGGGGSTPSIPGTGGAGLAFNAPSVPQSNPTTNLSQDSINGISAGNSSQQTQVVVSESDITNTQSRVASYQQAGTI